MGEALTPPLEAMLDAREARWRYRCALAPTCRALVSATVCVPLPLRTQERCKAFLRASVRALRAALTTEGIGVSEAEELDGADGLTVFLRTDGDPARVKACCCALEESLPNGRLLDADVMDASLRQLSRTELGLPPRRCFLCGAPAAACVASGRHPPREVAAWIEARLFDTE